MNPSRRNLLRLGTLGAGSLVGAHHLGILDPLDRRPTAAASVRIDPFTLGVASGDPEPDGVVLWTRLAVDPTDESGLGGMPTRRVTVSWQVGTDERMRRIVRTGTVSAGPETAHAVHVEVGGLRPGTEYFYRFRIGTHLSPIGRTRTAPARRTMPGALAMAFASCAQFEHGWFTAYRRMAEEQPDLILHLGDYQYEYKAGDYVAKTGNVRDHLGPETVTLANYRQRHAQYKADLDLQAAHAVAPWLVTFDDHEVDNNWADLIPENPADQAGFAQRRAAAFRAYYENMPLRRSSVPRGPDIQAFRRIEWGSLATFHMLDTRQFRDDQACGDGYDDCADARVPDRTITGERQERWLRDGFQRSRARWDLLGQQVFFAQRDSDAGPLQVTSMDAWDGYTASRDRIQRAWVEAGVRNPVVLTGDVHAFWASDLKADYDDPDSAVIGTELVTSSITSGGDGADSPTGAHPWATWNPHLRFWTDLRGYVATTITSSAITADYRAVPRVSVPGAPAFSRARFRIEDRHPGLDTLRVSPLPRDAEARSLRGRSDAQIGRDTIAQETQPTG